MMHSAISTVTIFVSLVIYWSNPEVIRSYIAVSASILSAVNEAKIINIPLQKFLLKKGRKT